MDNLTLVQLQLFISDHFDLITGVLHLIMVGWALCVIWWLLD